MFSQTILSSIEFFSTSAMVGVIWLVQLLVYPSFKRVPPDYRVEYHRQHTTRISFVVIPLMLMELATGVMIAMAEWPELCVARWAALASLSVVWLSTFAIQVPLHQRLAYSADDRTIHRLIRTNWIRTLAWTVKALLLINAQALEH